MTTQNQLHMMQIPEKTAIIGKIPGYNKSIDATGKFQHDLLKGITIIDLRPVSYQFLGGPKDQSSFSNFGDIFNNPKGLLELQGLFNRNTSTSKQVFSGVLDRMQEGFGLSKFSGIEMLRILGVNDSTFTETFSNSFDGQNVAKAAWGSKKIESGQNQLSKIYSAAKTAVQGYKSISHSDMISAIGGVAAQAGNLSGNNALGGLLTGAISGLDIATPSVWQQSSYSSTLTLFVKLVAPTGSAKCIQENILKPLLYLLSAGSPLTYSGSVYGYPLLWDIQAHGITNFRVGAIAAMSLIRGSFETSFNHNLQPTVIDVRLTLVPLLNDFAVQTKPKDTNAENIYNNPDFLGVQNPGDIVRGITNGNTSKSTSKASTGKVQMGRVDIKTIKL